MSLKVFWDDEDLLKIEVDKVRRIYNTFPIPISKDTKSSDIKNYLAFIRSQTFHGLNDSYKLLRLALRI